MPEYLSPGVYVEEAPHRARRIEGAPTDLAVFVGVLPHALPDDPAPSPRLVHGWDEFVRHYGSAAHVEIAGVIAPNYMAHATHAYFGNGGRRLYVVPVMQDGANGPSAALYAAALASSLEIADISLVHAPGASTSAQHEAIEDALVSHVNDAPGRFLVLDPAAAQDLAQVRAARARLDSAHAALYYPWVVAADVFSANATPVHLPPGGFICGVYMRTDVERGHHIPPANEVIRGALDFETPLNRAQQEVLNPEGINCLRFFEGRGRRVWGARTMSSDPEWKYVNVRRYFDYLQRSLGRAGHWTVFEPNADALWSRLRSAIEDFLMVEWRKGALQGTRPEQAWFVRCDRSTMSQDDLDHGRLVCLIGIAFLKPAEFVVLRLVLPTVGMAG